MAIHKTSEISTSSVGEVRFNTTLNTIEIYRSGVWYPLSGYESGTFTGTLGMDSNANATSPTINANLNSTGQYCLNGNLCTFNIAFDVTNFSNHLAVRISGLPFAAQSGGSGYPITISGLRGIKFRYSTTTLDDFELFGSIQPGSSFVNLNSCSHISAFSGFWYINNEPGQGKNINVGGSYAIA